MSGWLNKDNDPGPAELTPKYLQELSAAAQQAELAGKTDLANAIHEEINHSLDDLK